MSEHGKEGAMSCLFSKQDMRLKNVKFFRGDRDVITEDEFRAQIQSIEDQKKANPTLKSRKAPLSSQPITQVREFVGKL